MKVNNSIAVTQLSLKSIGQIKAQHLRVDFSFENSCSFLLWYISVSKSKFMPLCKFKDVETPSDFM
jgi:hypothetical protein